MHAQYQRVRGYRSPLIADPDDPTRLHAGYHVQRELLRVHHRKGEIPFLHARQIHRLLQRFNGVTLHAHLVTLLLEYIHRSIVRLLDHLLFRVGSTRALQVGSFLLTH